MTKSIKSLLRNLERELDIHSIKTGKPLASQDPEWIKISQAIKKIG